MEANENIQVASELIIKHFSFLESNEKSFKSSSKIGSDYSFLEKLNVVYLNEEKDSIGKDFELRITDPFDKEKANLIVSKLAESLRVYAADIIDGKLWLGNFYPRKD